MVLDGAFKFGLHSGILDTRQARSLRVFCGSLLENCGSGVIDTHRACSGASSLRLQVEGGFHGVHTVNFWSAPHATLHQWLAQNILLQELVLFKAPKTLNPKA